MPEERVSTAEVAKRFGVTARQVRNLRDQGMPCHPDGTYPWPSCRVWRDEQLKAIGRREAVPDGEGEARARKLSAEAQLAELNLERARGELVPIRDVERVWGLVLDRLRARLLAAPGKWAPRLGLPIAQAQVKLEDVVRELITDLADAADDLPDTLAEDDAAPAA